MTTTQKLKAYKAKKCKSCDREFIPIKSLQSVCCYNCAINYANEKATERIRLKVRSENKVKLDKMKTRGEIIAELQIIFNRWVRLRDKGLPCIACNKPIPAGHENASHYFPTGLFGNIRFDPDNCHNGCDQCNGKKRGNLAEYTIHLPKRIGQERFQALQERRYTPNKLSIPEILELKEVYKLKIKQLCAEKD